MTVGRDLIAGLAVSVLLSAVAHAESPDSLVARVRAMMQSCDSQIVDLSYLATVHEQELRDDGTVKSEKTYKSRHFVRDEENREFLEAMWEDGEPVATSKLADERKKRDKERTKKRKLRVDKKSDDEDNSHSQEMLGPLQDEHFANYRFPFIVEDTLEGLPCWKLSVEPVREDEDLVKGYIWFEQGSDRPLAEQYELSKRPGGLKEFGIKMSYLPLFASCAMLRRLHLHGKGKALLVIKFNFAVEVLLDSVLVNHGVPDSLFATPADE